MKCILLLLLIVCLVKLSVERSDSGYTRACSNGQGIVYSDSDYETCECFNCFDGDYCENEKTNCYVDCSGGNPSLAQQYWEHVLVPSTETVSEAYYRAPYMLHGGIIPPEPEPAYEIDQYLRTSIYNIHKLVGNAEYEDAYIVYGHGGTELINAAAYSLALGAGRTLPVFAQAPYYNQYKAWAEFNLFNNYWNASYTQNDYEDSIIEFVTSPNNPTGEIRTAHYNESSNLVYDMVYYWPTWTNITYTANHDIMIFSLSKLSGHAGTRFGWALVKNFTVAVGMRSFINLMNIHTSMDTLHRAITILNTMVAQDGQFFTNISSVMSERYSKIIPMFESQSRFSLQSVTNPPTWFYMWIKCEQDVNCYDVFREAGILGEPGTLYGATPNYVRIQLTMRSIDFNLFLERFQTLLTS